MAKNQNKINFNGLKKQIAEFKKIKIYVGILDPIKKARKPRKPNQFKTIKGTGQIALKTGKSSKISLYKLGYILDHKYKIFTNFNRTKKNRYYNKMVEAIKDLFKTDSINARLKIERFAIKYVQFDIIHNNKYSNAISTVKQKGFNKPMIQTGTFYNNIKAKVVIK